MRRFLAVIVAASIGGALVLYAATRPNGLFAPRMPEPARQDEVSVALKGSGLRLRLGVPDVMAPANPTAMREAAGLVADVLWSDLDFEGEYQMIPRAASAMLPQPQANVPPLEAWAGLGADLILVVDATSHDAPMLDIRVVWARGEHVGEPLFTRRYPCADGPARAVRTCAHQIADDIHLETRGLQGIATTHVAYVSDRDRGHIAGSSTIALAKEVYLSDYDGANPTRLTSVRSTTCCVAWSSPRALTYVSWQAGWPDIYQLNVAEPAQPQPRPAGSRAWVNNWSPAWSPDGARLAFASNRSGNVDLWVVNADGSGLVNLTNHPSADGAPTWSPDGSQIAFTSDRTGTNALYVINADGGAARVLVREQVDRPSWSATNVIAYTLAPDAGHKAIGLYDIATGRATALTDGSFDCEHPSLSPNGRHIAFETTRWGGHQIAVMDRTGANMRPITNAGENGYPSWQR